MKYQTMCPDIHERNQRITMIHEADDGFGENIMQIKNKKIVEINFPDSLVGAIICESEYLTWLNDMLSEGKEFCGFLPGHHGTYKAALFIIDDEVVS